MKSLMKEEMNPTFTEVSYWLFHKPEAASQDRFEILVRNPEVLLAKADGILRHKPPYFADRTTDFEEHAISLPHYATGLRQTALEKNLLECIHLFTHMKNTCHSCHQTYLFGEDTPIRRR